MHQRFFILGRVALVRLSRECLDELCIRYGCFFLVYLLIHYCRKKQEQAGAREAIKEARKAGMDVDGGYDDRRAGGVEVD